MIGARTIRRGEEGWPARLDELRDPPEFLRVKGALPGPADRTVAVVGARLCDPEGLELARRLGAALARSGAWVISGGAAGVDAAAHRGAIEAGGRTLVVLAGGLDRLYPAGNRPLFARAVEAGGGLLCEEEDAASPAPYRFVERNRIVAALGEGTLVVRAGAGSGSLITAARAREMGRPVLVAGDGGPAEYTAGLGELVGLPGTGAGTFRDEAGALAALGLVLPAAAVEAASEAASAASALEGPEATLWGALGTRHEPADVVARRAGMPAAAALVGLMSLELRGLVEQKAGRGFARRA